MASKPIETLEPGDVIPKYGTVTEVRVVEGLYRGEWMYRVFTDERPEGLGVDMGPGAMVDVEDA